MPIEFERTELWTRASPLTNNVTQNLVGDGDFDDYQFISVQASIIIQSEGPPGPFKTYLIDVEQFKTRPAYIDFGRYGCYLTYISNTQFNRTDDTNSPIGIESITGLRIPGNVYTDTDNNVVTSIPSWVFNPDANLPPDKLPDTIPADKLPEDRLMPAGSASDNGRVAGYNAQGHPVILDRAVVTHDGTVEIQILVRALKAAGAKEGDILFIGNGENLVPRHIALQDWSDAFDQAYRDGIISDDSFAGRNFLYLTFTKP